MQIVWRGSAERAFGHYTHAHCGLEDARARAAVTRRGRARRPALAPVGAPGAGDAAGPGSAAAARRARSAGARARSPPRAATAREQGGGGERARSRARRRRPGGGDEAPLTSDASSGPTGAVP